MRRPDRAVSARLDDAGAPTAFCWYGRWYRVAERLDEWVYRTPWWVEGAEEQSFYRVRVAEGGVFELMVGPDRGVRVYRVFD